MTRPALHITLRVSNGSEEGPMSESTYGQLRNGCHDERELVSLSVLGGAREKCH